MSDFAKAVSDFFLKERGINVASLGFKKMPEEREKYDLSKIRGNAALTQNNFMIKSEADKIIGDFLFMPIP